MVRGISRSEKMVSIPRPPPPACERGPGGALFMATRATGCEPESLRPLDRRAEAREVERTLHEVEREARDGQVGAARGADDG